MYEVSNVEGPGKEVRQEEAGREKNQEHVCPGSHVKKAFQDESISAISCHKYCSQFRLEEH